MSAVWLPLLFSLGPPLLVAYSMTVGRARGKLDWLLSALVCAGVALLVHAAATVWLSIGVRWRWLPLAVAAGALLWSARKARPRRSPARRSRRWFAHAAARGAAAIVLSIFLLDILFARKIPGGAVDLAFPLSPGRYAVVHGGASRLLNHHAAVPAQAHAMDLVALNGAGRRASGARPERLEAYEIFNREVVSPCAGRVSGMSDNAPDGAIGGPLPVEGAAGNYVLLSCSVEGRDITVLLAHLRAGSMAVDIGGEVERGALLGRVGNSGRSSEPHLHIHAVRGLQRGLDIVLKHGEAVPLTFEKRVFVRNSVINIRRETGRPDAEDGLGSITMKTPPNPHYSANQLQPRLFAESERK